MIRALYCDTHYIATSPKPHCNQYPNPKPHPNPFPKSYPTHTLKYTLTHCTHMRYAVYILCACVFRHLLKKINKKYNIYFYFIYHISYIYHVNIMYHYYISLYILYLEYLYIYLISFPYIVHKIIVNKNVCIYTHVQTARLAVEIL